MLFKDYEQFQIIPIDNHMLNIHLYSITHNESSRTNPLQFYHPLYNTQISKNIQVPKKYFHVPVLFTDISHLGANIL